MQEFLKYMAIFLVVGIVGWTAYDHFLNKNNI